MIDLDEALERFHHGGLEYGPGFANHGPMAAEALIELGHGALVTGWLDLYAPRLPDLEVGEPLLPGERDEALGRFEFAPRWIASFEAEVAVEPWRYVLARALRPLAPGLFAGAGHGLLRVAHAVRSLGRADTAARRTELAHGLAYWAARFQRLPGEPGAGPRVGRSDALAAIPVVPLDARRPGLFTEAVAELSEFRGFVDAVAAFDPADGAPAEILTSLSVFGAEAYLANLGSRIAYVHAVTVPSALRLLLEHMDDATTRVALGACFQTVAALHAVSAGAPEVPVTGGWSGGAPTAEEIAQVAASPAELRYRAACSLEEHAIKFACACLIENEIAPNPVYLRAAADAALGLEGSARSPLC